MWILLMLLAVAPAAGLQWWWSRRERALRERWETEREDWQRGQQQATLEAQARQQVVFDAMLEGLLLLDRHRKIHLANRAFQHLFALKGEVRGRTVIEALRVPELEELVNQVEAHGRVLNYELKLPDLTERWLQVNAAAIYDSNGGREGAILVFHDLTRLKQLERTREEFVANVSHELRTPLSLIKGYVETLLDGARHQPEVAERFLKIIERNTQRLDLLIQDLLTISALESERIKLTLSPTPLRPLADKVLTDLQARAEAKNTRLINEAPEVWVAGDVHRLDQVLANLVENAIKYGRQGGRVVVGGEPLGDGRVQISVRDDGPGIPPESLDRVFERFYRVDKARSRDQGGTGLGLSIVKHIVQAHGGAVWVESEPGKGAVFYFTLPEGTPD